MTRSTEHSGHDLAAAFSAQRPRLRSIAYRVLGSYWDADDAVQEAWLRLQRADGDEIRNLEAWLTVVVSRASLDLLRARGARREDVDADVPDDDSGPTAWEPEGEAVRADEVGAAILVVLDALSPLERLAFVLHDVFGLAFDDIAPIVERTPAAARQLASRARRRVRDVNVTAERSRQRKAVEAFLKASREGEFGDLLQLLDPEVELRADADAVAAATPNVHRGAPALQARVRGADAVARVFAGRAEQAQVALIDEFTVVAAYAPGGRPQALFTFQLQGGRIGRIEVIADAAQISDLAIALV